MKDLLDTKQSQELLESLVAEIAKANNEISCAKRDIEKAQRRIQFATVLANKLIEREKIDGPKETSNQTQSRKDNT